MNGLTTDIAMKAGEVVGNFAETALSSDAQTYGTALTVGIGLYLAQDLIKPLLIHAWFWVSKSNAPDEFAADLVEDETLNDAFGVDAATFKFDNTNPHVVRYRPHEAEIITDDLLESILDDAFDINTPPGIDGEKLADYKTAIAQSLKFHHLGKDRYDDSHKIVFFLDEEQLKTLQPDGGEALTDLARNILAEYVSSDELNFKLPIIRHESGGKGSTIADKLNVGIKPINPDLTRPGAKPSANLLALKSISTRNQDTLGPSAEAFA